jgi:hypothetical protein
MSDAWIGVVGAAIGAAAGLLGAYMSGRASSRSAVNKDVRDAAAELIGMARTPGRMRMVYEAGNVERAQLVGLVVDWFEDLTAAYSKVVVASDDENVAGAAGYLWQRASDQFLALLGRPEAQYATPEEIDSEIESAIWSLQNAVSQHHGSGRAHTQDGLD